MRYRLESTDHFYFLCHPESEADAMGLACGRGWDPPLTRDGMNCLRRLLRQPGLKALGIRSIVCGPLLRCVQTAAIMHDALQVSISAHSDLTDRHLGKWEKLKIRELPGYELGEGPIPGGEAIESFEARVHEGLGAALGRPGPVLLISHFRVGRIMLRSLGLAAESSGLPLEKGVIFGIHQRPNAIPEWEMRRELAFAP